jgi:hypothetical protein
LLEEVGFDRIKEDKDNSVIIAENLMLVDAFSGISINH